MRDPEFLLFALGASRPFAEKICSRLRLPLSAHEEREFEDGEHKARPLVNVRNRHVFVIHSLYGEPQASANDKLCRLLFFIGALKDAAAASVTAVIPYLCYARKDRKTKSRDPVTTRYLAALFETLGTDRVVTVDVHNLAAYQNAFRCQTEHLEAAVLFAEYFSKRTKGEDLVVVSPDVGGVKRAERLQSLLVQRTGRPVGAAFVEKHRSGGVVRGGALVGDVGGRTAIILDDLISTGGTLARAAHACKARGARRVMAAATHGLFIGGAEELIADAAIEKVVVTDSVPPFRLDAKTIEARIEVLEIAPLVAEAIRRMHAGGSLVDLLEI
jgi:ribose-phosphate pyrophosphokinase